MEDVAFELGIAVSDGNRHMDDGWEDILNNRNSLSESLEVEQHLALIRGREMVNCSLYWDHTGGSYSRR